MPGFLEDVCLPLPSCRPWRSPEALKSSSPLGPPAAQLRTRARARRTGAWSRAAEGLAGLRPCGPGRERSGPLSWGAGTPRALTPGASAGWGEGAPESAEGEQRWPPRPSPRCPSPSFCTEVTCQAGACHPALAQAVHLGEYLWNAKLLIKTYWVFNEQMTQNCFKLLKDKLLCAIMEKQRGESIILHQAIYLQL